VKHNILAILNKNAIFGKMDLIDEEVLSAKAFASENAKDIFWEMGLIDDHPRSATVTVFDESEESVIPKSVSTP
jgi:hypothetical protein